MSRRRLTTVAAFLLLCIGLGAAGLVSAGEEKTKPEDAEAAYEKMIDERHTFPDVKDRMAMTKAYLAEYPETKYTARLLGHVFYYQGEASGDVPGAIAYAEDIRKKIDDPEIGQAVDLKLVELYGRAGMTDKMLELAKPLEADGALKFGDYWNIIEAGVDQEEWDVVKRYCEKAGRLASADAYRKEWPQYDFTDEEAKRAARNRKGMLLAKGGWAKANTNRVKEALADFESASGLINHNYVGIPDYDLNRYWATALLENGDFAGAIEKYAPDALIMGSEEALEGLERAYAGKNGSDEGFEAFAQKLHVKIAKQVDDFELHDYQGRQHRFADLRGEVTLLSFWFPT